LLLLLLPDQLLLAFVSTGAFSAYFLQLTPGLLFDLLHLLQVTLGTTAPFALPDQFSLKRLNPLPYVLELGFCTCVIRATRRQRET
jgi:hypothetical protein